MIKNIILIFCLLYYTNAPSQAYAEETPHILIGDWYPIHLECKSPQALKNGWNIDENLKMSSLNGNHSCQFVNWKYYDTSSVKEFLGEWSFEEICINNIDRNQDSNSKKYGWMRVYSFKNEIRLDINTSDNDPSGIFESPENLSGLQLKRCNSS